MMILENCYSRITNLINAEISNGSKDYDLEYIRNHVNKLIFLNFHIHLLS
jgi:guanylate kinase